MTLFSSKNKFFNGIFRLFLSKTRCVLSARMLCVAVAYLEFVEHWVCILGNRSWWDHLLLSERCLRWKLVWMWWPVPSFGTFPNRASGWRMMNPKMVVDRYRGHGTDGCYSGLIWYAMEIDTNVVKNEFFFLLFRDRKNWMRLRQKRKRLMHFAVNLRLRKIID